MKRVTTICLAAVFGCVAAVGAELQQGQTQQTQTQRERPATGDRTGQRETGTQAQAQGRNAATTSFIGCVEAGTTANSFVLNVVELPASMTTQGGASATTTGAGQTTAQGQVGANVGTGQGTANVTAQANAGQTGTRATGTTGVMVGQRIELTGANNLAAHRGHKVEITGMTVPRGTATGRGGQAAADMRLNVTNIRHIDNMCAPASSTQGTSGATRSPMPAPQNQNTQPQPGTPTSPR